MIDLRLVRSDPDGVRAALARRGDAELLDPVLALDTERRALLEAEATRGREAERLRAHDVGLKQMEMAAARDREHSERMLQMSRMELDSQRQANDMRMARDREEGDRREQERIRQHERMVKEAELQSQKDREHAERMMQLTQMQMRGDSFGGLAEMIPKAKELLGTLGIDAGDLIDRFMKMRPRRESWAVFSTCGSPIAATMRSAAVAKVAG